MRTLSTNQSVNLNQPRIDQSIINGNKKEDKTKKNNSYGTIATVASYLTGATTGFLLAARVFSTLLLTSPALGTAGCLAIAALIGIASATILTKGLLFLLNACRNYCNSCLPIKKSESYIDPGQNLSAKQKEEQYKEALKNVSNLLCADRAFKESLLEAIDPENIGNISEKNLKEILAKGFVSTFLGTEPDEILENSKKLVDVAKKIIKEADEETKTKLIKSANDVLKNAQVPYQLVPQASDKQECRIIDLSADTISPEDAEILVKFYGSRSLEEWYEFLNKAKATPAVRGEILKAYLEMHFHEMLNELGDFLYWDESFKNLFANTTEARVKSLKNEEEISKLNPVSIFAETCVHFFMETKVNETSENSKELLDLVEKSFEEADEETKKKLIEDANIALLDAKKPYQLVPQANDKQKYRIIVLKAETISPEDAKDLLEYYENETSGVWCDFLCNLLNVVKAKKDVREEILKAYLEMHSNEVLNEIEKFLGSDESFKNLFTNTTEARVKSLKNEEEISELNPVSIFAEVYVQIFLGTDPNETSKNSEKLVDVAQKIIEEADEETKTKLIKSANDVLKNAQVPYQLVLNSENQTILIEQIKTES